MKTIIKEFREKLRKHDFSVEGYNEAWQNDHPNLEINKARDNVNKAREEIEQFILSKLKEVAKGIIGEEEKFKKSPFTDKDYDAFAETLKLGRHRHRQQAIDYCNKIGLDINLK